MGSPTGATKHSLRSRLRTHFLVSIFENPQFLHLYIFTTRSITRRVRRPRHTRASENVCRRRVRVSSPRGQHYGRNDTNMSDTKHRLEASAGLSRRTFLYSLGALALSACGSGPDTSEAAAAGRATGTADAAAGNRALARVATGTDAVMTSQAFVTATNRIFLRPGCGPTSIERTFLYFSETKDAI